MKGFEKESLVEFFVFLLRESILFSKNFWCDDDEIENDPIRPANSAAFLKRNQCG